jgi:hypothetical protein
MLGREVDIKASDKDDFLANTLSAIEATTAESGEVVGLPIDAGNHDKGDAAGWIVGAELVGDIIRFIPKWTVIGRELIAEGIRRFFSPTVNLRDKVILGGALVNWPASTDKMGRVLLRPIELSNNIHSIEVDTMSDNDKTDEKVPAATSDGKQPEPAAKQATMDLTKAEPLHPELIAELRTQIRDDVRAELQAEYKAQLVRDKEQRHIADFARRMTGGSADAPRGLPVGVEEIETFLADLPQAQREAVESILTRTVEKGLVEFGEVGHSKRFVNKGKLDPAIASSLTQWVESGLSVDRFFVENPELGDASQYDLSKCEEGE